MIILAFLAAVFSFGIVFLIIHFYGTGGFVENRRRIKDRLRQEAEVPKVEHTEIRKKYNISQAAMLQQFFSRFTSAEMIAILLKTARIGMSVSMFCMISLLMTALSFLICHYFNLSIYLKIGIPVLFLITPMMILSANRKKYVGRFHQFLPDTLGIISNAIKVGHNLESAIQVVSVSAPKPVCDEFTIIKAELKLGLPLKKALDNLYLRMGGRELKILITGIAVHDELGGNLSEILDNLQQTIRERYELRREIRALSAQGIVSALVLFALPFFFVGLWLKADPKLFMSFFQSTAGKISAGFCVLSQLVAFLWIRQTIKIKE